MSFNVYVNDFELVDLIGIRKNKSPKYRSHSGSLSMGYFDSTRKLIFLYCIIHAF